MAVVLQSNANTPSPRAATSTKNSTQKSLESAIKNPWRRLWQVPLLLGGLTLFGWGVKSLVAVIRPIPFEVQARGVRELLAVENYPRAIEQINILAAYFKEPRQQGELEQLAGDAFYLSQKKQPAPVRENYQAVLDHYQRAVAAGIPVSVTMNERWGESALALGDPKTAIAKWEAAIAGDAAGRIVDAHARELVNAYVAGGEMTKAYQILNRLLARGTAAVEGGGEGHVEAVDNRSWALCKQIEIALRSPAHAAGTETLSDLITRARNALKTLPERDPAARILTWIGRAELEAGNMDAAQVDLADARARFVGHTLDDGRAALLLAKIAEARGDSAKAAELYQNVVIGQAGTSLWPAARFGRADMLVRTGQPITDTLLADYHFAITAINEAEPATPVELMNRQTLRSALVADYQRAADADHLADALTFLALQQQLEPDPAAPQSAPDDEAMAFRLAATKERRGNELLQQAADLPDYAQRAAQEAAGRALLADAAADYLRHAHLTTMQDAISGNSLWKAAQLLDRAGYALRAFDVFNQFAIQRPRDPRVAEGLFSMGRLYQSAGLAEKAIPIYQRNIRENPKTPAAYASAIGLARCYMTLAEALTDPPATSPAATQSAAATAPATSPATAPPPETKLTRTAAIDSAEAALLSLVQENSDLLPASNEFHTSLLVLGELYYNNARWADAILRLDEAAERYPNDPALPRVLFMLAESYRKSAAEIAHALAGDSGASTAAAAADPALAGGRREALENARRIRLSTAADIFTRIIERLDPEAGPSLGRKLTTLEDEYLHASYMDRAACYFDRTESDLPTAIKLYDEAATRFAEESLAARAYVQIVNAYMALKQPTQANAAAERGRWVLKRIPDSAFTLSPGDGELALGREDYEKLLTIGRR